ncbi:hypothetical protein SAMN06265222_11452 [Neorhodopirellula lusitana]|uniref:Uncharacterized protein n=1 Tax=Neorhodopirellula lusitana TaxID=445327 RepID=A0ABY1QH63_9BACT|nr:hypothetical protein SAMN06265222_11452 [Neorhodopirellula lusitana]
MASLQPASLTQAGNKIGRLCEWFSVSIGDLPSRCGPYASRWGRYIVRQYGPSSLDCSPTNTQETSLWMPNVVAGWLIFPILR